MDTFSEVFKAIASYPWQVNVGVLSLIPLYKYWFTAQDSTCKGAWTCGERHDYEGGCEEARCQ